MTWKKHELVIVGVRISAQDLEHHPDGNATLMHTSGVEFFILVYEGIEPYKNKHRRYRDDWLPPKTLCILTLKHCVTWRFDFHSHVRLPGRDPMRRLWVQCRLGREKKHHRVHSCRSSGIPLIFLIYCLIDRGHRGEVLFTAALCSCTAD